MSELSITVLLAERSYRLTISEEEEEWVRKAAKSINDKLTEYANQYAFRDKQDLLAMVCLYFATLSENSSRKMEGFNEELTASIEKIFDILNP